MTKHIEKNSNTKAVILEQHSKASFSKSWLYC